MKKTGFFTSAMLTLFMGWQAKTYAQSTEQHNNNQINAAKNLSSWVNNIDQSQYQDSVSAFLKRNEDNEDISDMFKERLENVLTAQTEVDKLKGAKARLTTVDDLSSGSYDHLLESPFIKEGIKVLNWSENMHIPSVRDKVAQYLNDAFKPGSTKNYDFVLFNGNMKRNQFVKVNGDEYWGPMSQVGRDRVRPDVKAENLKNYGFEVAPNIEFENQGLNHFTPTFAAFRNYRVPTNVNDFKHYIAFNKRNIDFKDIATMWENIDKNIVLDFYFKPTNDSRQRKLVRENHIANHALTRGGASETHINWRPGDVHHFPVDMLLEKALGMSFGDFEYVLEDIANGYNNAHILSLALDKANANLGTAKAQLDFQNMLNENYAEHLAKANSLLGDWGVGFERGFNLDDNTYSHGGFVLMPGPLGLRLRFSGSYTPDNGQFATENFNLGSTDVIRMDREGSSAGRNYTSFENKWTTDNKYSMSHFDRWNLGLGVEIFSDVPFLGDIFLGGNFGQEIKTGTAKGIEVLENYRTFADQPGVKKGYIFDEDFMPSKHVQLADKLVGMYIAFHDILNSGISASIEGYVRTPEIPNLNKKTGEITEVKGKTEFDHVKLNVGYDAAKLVEFTYNLFK